MGAACIVLLCHLHVEHGGGNHYQVGFVIKIVPVTSSAGDVVEQGTIVGIKKAACHE